jgi:hypothetical protein
MDVSDTLSIPDALALSRPSILAGTFSPVRAPLMQEALKLASFYRPL